MQNRVFGPFAPPHPHGEMLSARMTARGTARPASVAELARAHVMLYRQIPSFECEPGCTSCCGVIAMSALEWAQVADKRSASADCAVCPYSAGGDCAIHPKRPLICRLFGAVDDPRLACPKGRGPARKLSAQQAAELMDAYQHLMADSSEAVQ